jgi:hypothetical protein
MRDSINGKYSIFAFLLKSYIVANSSLKIYCRYIARSLLLLKWKRNPLSKDCDGEFCY